MYILQVQRLKEYKAVKDLKGRTEDSTIGEVTLTNTDNGEVIWRGFSCENIGPSTDTPSQDKRIVAREYNLEWKQTKRNSNKSLGKWQNKALWLTCDSTLPSFRYRMILIHTGNFPSDTEGCLLFGKTDNKKGAVNSSVQAITELFNIIDKLDPKNVKCIIKEIK